MNDPDKTHMPPPKTDKAKTWTPQQFYQWLAGYRDAMGGRLPTEEDRKVIIMVLHQAWPYMYDYDLNPLHERRSKRWNLVVYWAVLHRLDVEWWEPRLWTRLLALLATALQEPSAEYEG